MWSSAHPNLPANSLRTGNLTGNFSGIGPFGRFSCPIDQINQWLAPQFPEHERTGNFFAGTGNFRRRIRELDAGSGNLDSRRWSGAERSLSRGARPGKRTRGRTTRAPSRPGSKLSGARRYRLQWVKSRYYVASATSAPKREAMAVELKGRTIGGEGKV